MNRLCVSLIPGSAIVSVFAQDGTVLLTHGGVEMGQGINTKIMQIAALELNIPMCIIRTHENSTDKVCTNLQYTTQHLRTILLATVCLYQAFVIF